MNRVTGDRAISYFVSNPSGIRVEITRSSPKSVSPSIDDVLDRAFPLEYCSWESTSRKFLNKSGYANWRNGFPIDTLYRNETYLDSRRCFRHGGTRSSPHSEDPRRFRFAVRPNDAVQLRTPDGRILDTHIAYFSSGKPSGGRRFYDIVLLRDLQKRDVPIGTEVWLADGRKIAGI